MTIAVIGAGIHGASAALSLAQRGHDVTLFERDVPASKSGSSHGRSRIVRLAYPDPFYTHVMAEGYPMWRELEACTGETLIHECGLLYFGVEGSETLAQVESGLREVGDLVVRVTAGDPHCGGIHLLKGEVGLFSPRAGWVNAERAVLATVAQAVGTGAKLVPQNADPIQISEHYDVVLVTTGAELAKWFPEELQVRVQTVAYVDVSHEGPVYIEDGGDFFYGFPNAPGETSMKVGIHNVGTPWKGDVPRPDIDEPSLIAMADFVKRRFDRDEVTITESLTCLYTMTPDEDFRWGWVGDNVFWVSACSGHGFKFGPWIGKKCADFVERRDDPAAYSRFYRNWEPVGAYNG